jgi:dihydroorotase
VLVDLNQTTAAKPDTLYAKCGWSPFEGTTFHSRVTHTFVSGHLAYAQGIFDEPIRGKRLVFSR